MDSQFLGIWKNNKIKLKMRTHIEVTAKDKDREIRANKTKGEVRQVRIR